MRFKLYAILLLMVLMAGCSSSAKSQMPPVQELSRLQVQPPMGLDEIKVLDAVTTIKRGSTGSITIQGQAGVTYHITSTFRLGDKTLSTYQPRTAGNNGEATWTWNVADETVAGSYPITISGGGKTLVTSYTVTP